MVLRWVLVALLALSPAAWGFDLRLIHEDQTWSFTLEELKSLPQTGIETETPWTEQSDYYEGIALTDLLAATPIDTDAFSQLRMTALNDYAVDAPIQKLTDADAVIVYQRDGEAMPVRDFGPYWMLFPFSDRPELENREIRNVSVWQLKSIELLP